MLKRESSGKFFGGKNPSKEFSTFLHPRFDVVLQSLTSIGGGNFNKQIIMKMF
jgi:hypothetical protein